MKEEYTSWEYFKEDGTRSAKKRILHYEYRDIKKLEDKL